MRTGVLFGLGAYGLWGLFPLYFPLLDPAGSVEVLAHRIVWSLVVVVAGLVALRRLPGMVRVLRAPRTLALLAAAAVLIAVNWGLYIYAVTSDHTIEAALGYFINPLVSVAFGVVFFAERLRRAQVAALALGTAAVAVLTTASGGFPWISLVLATSFGTYGLLKKLAAVGAAESLGVETLVLAPVALAYLLVIGADGSGTFTSDGAGHTALLVAAGPVTAVPLILFAACVARVPLTMVGLLQYLTPTLQFLIGWLVQGEHMPLARWIGFALVWIALVALATDGLRAAARERAGRGVAPLAEVA
jgi:chloramphenicol-sensitive protein RarD